MDNWFTVDKIDDSTFAISEYKHWEETHCYLLCGKEHAVLIDTGMGISNIKKIVDSLTALPVTVMTTHVHWDHIGGHKYFKNFAVHESEVSWITGQFPLSLQSVKKNFMLKPCVLPDDFRLENYQIFKGYPTTVLHDNDIFDLGGRTLQVIHTPGHSPGHCCFYEKEKCRLYSGDLIYKGCLDAFYPTTDPQLFFDSVKKIQKYEIKRVLPGHHQLNVPVTLINEIENGFAHIEKNGQLKQGNGLFDFGDFQIHI